MNILLLAPHPYYQERGTPIAVDFLAKALSARGDHIDLLVFNEGEPRQYENVNLHRIHPIPAVTGVKPGFSAKKLYLDLWFFFKFLRLLITRRYDAVHAIEESGFMAMLLCPLFRTPYVLDMDSLMTTQIIDKLPLIKPLEKLLRFIESLPMRFAAAVVPVCDALADEVRRYRQHNIYILKDISLNNPEATSAEDLRSTLNIQCPIIMYIGNLEPYQGIDLLLDSFKQLIEKGDNAKLLIIGGSDADIHHYQQRCNALAIADQVQLLGKRPVSHISHYMTQADILVSPRTQGVNTPMKVYSYLDSGTAVLATDLPTHTQAMDSRIALLAPAEKDAFSAAMSLLLNAPEKRLQLAANAKQHIAKEHSYSAFCQQLDRVYQQLFNANNRAEQNNGSTKRSI